MRRLLLLAALAGCTSATEPHRIVVTCHERVVQTPQGAWHTGLEDCTWLDPVTGQGGAGRHP